MTSPFLGWNRPDMTGGTPAPNLPRTRRAPLSLWDRETAVQPSTDGNSFLDAMGRGSFVRNWLGNTTHPMQQQMQQQQPGAQMMPGMQPGMQMQQQMPYRPIGMPGASPMSFLMAAMGRR